MKETSNKHNLIQIIGKYYAYYIERLPYINWFNPLITIYLNFRSFPLRQALRFPVFVYGWPRLFSLYGKMECIGECKTGMITFNSTCHGAPSMPGTNSAIENWGRIIFHGKCQIYTSSKITVGLNGILDLGKGSRIMHFCNIVAYESVRIGAHSWVVHRCQVIDANFHYIADFNKNEVRRYTRPIKIGNYCWICNSTTISAGAIIPNKTIVASNSYVDKDMSDIPEESIIAGIPAKFIKKGYRRIDSIRLIRKIELFFSSNPDILAFPIDINTNHSICDVD